MPRGKRKRGAWDCQIWFDDGSRYRLTSINDGHSNADILASIRKSLIPILEAGERAYQKKHAAGGRSTAVEMKVGETDGMGLFATGTPYAKSANRMAGVACVG